MASITARAIGAAVDPPVEVWFWSTTAIATCGRSPYGPAKAMNQVVLRPGDAGLRGAGLAADAEARHRRGGARPRA